MGGSQGTTQQTTSPPPLLAKQDQYGAQQAVANYQSNAPQFYPGQQVANQSPTTQAGNQAATALGIHGDPANNAAEAYTQKTLGGGFLGPNPYQAQLDKGITDAVLPQVEGQFSAAGRYGSPSMGGVLTTSLADAIAPQHYQNYQNERGLMQQANAGAPNLAATNQSEIQGMQAAGANQDAYNQSNINANINHWNYNQNLQGNKLSQLAGLLGQFGGQQGQTSTSTQTAPSGGILGFLGGALGAAPGLLGAGGLPALFGA